MRVFQMIRAAILAWSTIAATLITIAAPSSAQVAEVPSKDDQDRSSALLRDIYRKQFEGAKTRADKSALAGKFLADAKAIDVPSDQYVLLLAAEKLAVGASDCELVEQIDDAIAARFKIEEVKHRASAMLSVDAESLPLAQRSVFIEKLAALCGRAILAEEFELSPRLVAIATDLAKAGRDQSAVRRTQQLAAHERECREMWQSAAKARTALVADGDDPAANNALGTYLCFVRREWDKGLPMLAKSNEEALRGLAETEIRGAGSGEQQLAIADGWWELMKNSAGVRAISARERADHWYGVAKARLSGLSRAKAEQRLLAVRPEDPLANSKGEASSFGDPTTSVKTDKEALSDFTGTWHICWSDGFKDQTWVIKADGTMLHKEYGHGGRLVRDEGDTLLIYDNGSVNRLNLSGSRLLIEQWAHTRRYTPDSRPSYWGTGTRVKTK